MRHRVISSVPQTTSAPPAYGTILNRELSVSMRDRQIVLAWDSRRKNSLREGKVAIESFYLSFVM